MHCACTLMAHTCTHCTGAVLSQAYGTLGPLRRRMLALGLAMSHYYLWWYKKVTSSHGAWVRGCGCNSSAPSVTARIKLGVNPSYKAPLSCFGLAESSVNLPGDPALHHYICGNLLQQHNETIQLCFPAWIIFKSP